MLIVVAGFLFQTLSDGFPDLSVFDMLHLFHFSSSAAASSLSCLVAMESFSGLGGLFSPEVSTAVSTIIVVRLSLHVSRSPVGQQ